MSSQTRPMPPLAPCSDGDVASFAALLIHLRSQPELARENEKLLNAEALAHLTEGVRAFQHAHLGRQARAMQWPLVRLPDEIFRDRSRSGPLFTALLAAYREKNSSSWRTFDLASPKRYNDSVDILRRMEKELTAAGFLRRPAIYLDETIPQDKRPGLREIVEEYKGTIVTDPTKASHVVAFDDEIDKDEDLANEEKREAEGQDPDKLYLRTVAMTDPSSSGAGGGSGSADAAQDHVAMVHWWYWPPSYDEWLPASDVSQVVETEAARMPGMPWVVSYRFIRDVQRHNEWGLEADYAIPDFQTKVALYKSSQGQKADAKRKGARASATSKQMAASGGMFAKRDRRSGTGMNPRSIVTGFYDVSGSRMRRVVHDGALRVPAHASALQQTCIETIVSTWPQKDKNEVLKALTQARNHALPAVDTLVRPSLDATEGSTLIVTEISASSSGGTVARNRNIALKTSIADRIRGGGDGAIDGDGDGDGDIDVEMHDAEAAPTSGDVQGTISEKEQAPVATIVPTNGDTNSAAKFGESTDTPMDVSPVNSTSERAESAQLDQHTDETPNEPTSTHKEGQANGTGSSHSSAALSAPSAAGAASSNAATAIADANSDANVNAAPAVLAPVAVGDSTPAPAPPTNTTASPQPPTSGQAPAEGTNTVQSVSERAEEPKPQPPAQVDTAVAASTANAAPTAAGDSTPAPAPPTNTTASPQPPTSGQAAAEGTNTAQSVSERAEEPKPEPLAQVDTAVAASTANPAPTAAGDSTPAPAPPTNATASPQPPTSGQAPAEGTNTAQSVSERAEEPKPQPPAQADTAVAASPANPAPAAAGNSTPAPAPPTNTTASPHPPTSGQAPAEGTNTAQSVSERAEEPKPQPPVLPDTAAAASTCTASSAAHPAEATSTGATFSPSAPSAPSEGVDTATQSEEKKDEQPPQPSTAPSSGADVKSRKTDDLPPAQAAPSVIALSDGAKQRAAAAVEASPSSAADGSATAETETPFDAPSWYDPNNVSELEKSLLPEWFNGSASHRTEPSYIEARQKMIQVSRADADKYLTATAIRRCVVGDAGSLLRLHEFLTHWRLINRVAAGESAPVVPYMRYEHQSVASRKRPVDESFWTDGRKQFLAKLVVESSNKRRKADRDAMPDSHENGNEKMGPVRIDWDAVAADVGGGVRGTECQRTFLSLPLTSSGDTEPSSDAGIYRRAQREEVLRDLIKDVRPEVFEAATKAALEATGDLNEAQNGALVGTIAAKAKERAVAEEETANELLTQLLDQRMLKMENRVALLDEIEGMLEAERVALELERRDLYTARCRHWFGGGN